MDIISYSKAKKAEAKADSVQSQVDQMPEFEILEADPVNPEPNKVYLIVQEKEPEVPISEYLFHFDASKLDLADGANVVVWEDLSGNGFDITQASSSLQPTFSADGFNGKPTVEFAGDYLQNSAFTLDGANDFYFAMAIHIDTTAGSQAIFTVNNSGGSEQPIYVYFSGSEQIARAVINGTNSASSTGMDVPRTLAVSLDSGTSRVFRNGVGQGTYTVPAVIDAHDTLTVGARGSGSPTFTGKISEIIYYPRALTDSDKNAVNSYLMSKWGIS